MAGKNAPCWIIVFILHALIQLSQRPQDPQGCASDQQKCVDSIVKADPQGCASDQQKCVDSIVKADPQGCASDQQKCVDSIVKALKNITFRFKRDFLQNFKVKNTAVNLLPQEGYQPSEEVERQRLQTRPQGHARDS